MPLIVGMTLTWLAPAFSTHAQRILNIIGNTLLLVVLVGLLYKIGVALWKESPWVVVAALLLATGSLLGMQLLLGRPSATVQTLSVCNANRHVGLALLLSGQQSRDDRGVPVIAAYALAALLVMWLYAKLARLERHKKRLLLLAKPWNCCDNTANNSIDRSGVLFLRIHFGAADAAEDEFARGGINKINYE